MRMVLVLLTSLRSFSSFWHGIARKRSLLVLRASVAIISTEKAATMSRVFCTFFPQKVPIAVCDWCCLPLFGRLLTAVFARGVLCTFWPQKVPKTPRQMPAPTSSRLTLAPGDYSRGRTCPVPFARAFSRAFVSRLRHRAGIVRGNSVFSAGKRSEHANMRTCEQGRTSLVLLFAENPGIAPGSGFQTAAFSLAAEKAPYVKNLKT